MQWPTHNFEHRHGVAWKWFATRYLSRCYYAHSMEYTNELHSDLYPRPYMWLYPSNGLTPEGCTATIAQDQTSERATTILSSSSTCPTNNYEPHVLHVLHVASKSEPHVLHSPPKPFGSTRATFCLECTIANLRRNT